MGAVLDAIYARRSVRRFKPDAVPRETLLELAKAGAAAPSAHNKQPWEFILVDDPGVMAALRRVHAYTDYNAPAAIAVCGNSDTFISNGGADFWIQDCSAAMENILLAALDLGVGTVWLGIYPRPTSIKSVRDILGLPEHVIPLGLVFAGTPVEQPGPRTQLRDDQVHWQKY